MFENRKDKKENLTIKDLYPDYTPEEQREAAETWNRYLTLVWRIYNRVKREDPKKIDENLFKR
jgi:DNA-directed RNA polymerase specialized sigma subunit